MKKICLIIATVLVAVAVVVEGAFLIKGKTYKAQNPIATIQIEGYEKPIKIELDPVAAPNAVANFVKLANKGFYNNYKMSIETDALTTDSSAEKAKLSQIVDYPQTDYTYGIKGDFIKNGHQNLIKHQKGVITMEREDYSYFGYTQEGYNSANSSFSILTADRDSYNENAAAFGKVVDGMDVLEAIAATRVEEDTNSENNENADNNEDETKNKITIQSITVDTFGVDYGIPEFVNYDENLQKVNNAYSQYFNNQSNAVTTTDDSTQENGTVIENVDNAGNVE